MGGLISRFGCPLCSRRPDRRANQRSSPSNHLGSNRPPIPPLSEATGRSGHLTRPPSPSPNAEPPLPQSTVGGVDGSIEESDVAIKALDNAPVKAPSQSGQSFSHRLQKIILKKTSGLFRASVSTLSRGRSTLSHGWSTLSRGRSTQSGEGSTGTPLEVSLSPMASKHRSQHLFSIDELQEGLVSDGGRRSETLNALDFTGRLSEITHRKSSEGFSKVSQAKLGNDVVAVKALRAPNNEIAILDENRMRKRLATEIYVWAELDHPNILRLLGFVFEDGKPCLVSPWCENGTLLEYLEKYPNVDRRQLVRQIAEGLRYLHSQATPIIHGDLKTGNILVTGEHVAKICGSGGSRYAEEARTGLTTAGVDFTNIRNSAPEILEGSQTHSLQSDVYSFACVTLETMTGKCPFWKIETAHGVIPKILYEKQTPSPEDHPGLNDPVLWDLLRRCWSHVPSDRPTMTDICKLLSGVGNGSSISLPIPEETSQDVLI